MEAAEIVSAVLGSAAKAAKRHRIRIRLHALACGSLNTLRVARGLPRVRAGGLAFRSDSNGGSFHPVEFGADERHPALTLRFLGAHEPPQTHTSLQCRWITPLHSSPNGAIVEIAPFGSLPNGHKLASLLDLMILPEPQFLGRSSTSPAAEKEYFARDWRRTFAAALLVAAGFGRSEGEQLPPLPPAPVLLRHVIMTIMSLRANSGQGAGGSGSATDLFSDRGAIGFAVRNGGWEQVSGSRRWSQLLDSAVLDAFVAEATKSVRGGV